jgi:hypothetical protein
MHSPACMSCGPLGRRRSPERLPPEPGGDTQGYFAPLLNGIYFPRLPIQILTTLTTLTAVPAAVLGLLSIVGCNLVGGTS